MAEAKDKGRLFRWGFFSATAVILVLICVGQVIGVMAERFGLPADAPPGTELAWSERFAGLGAKDWMFLAFLASSSVFLFLQRAAVQRFLRSMHAGVCLVGLSCVAVAVGVLIPQIDGFEDPTERVTAANYEEQYKAFRWAEGYFLYHLMHPYGIGMPEAALPPNVNASLERYGRRYGEEERSNREKQMRSAFTGNSKTKEIGALINRHDGAFRRFFDVATALHLNRTYKSHWFASLLGLLFLGVAFNLFKFRPAQWFTMKKVGFFTVHLGVMILLLGGAISKARTDRGILHMDLRDPPNDRYDGYGSREKPRWMPFALGLDRFARRDWKTLQVHFAGENFKSQPPSYTLWPGREIELDYAQDEGGEWKPRIRLRVLSLSERARVLPVRFFEAQKENEHAGKGPLAALSVTSPALAIDDPHSDPHASGGARSVYLTPDPRLNSFDDPAWRFRIRAAYGSDPEEARKLFPAQLGPLGYLAVRVAARGDVEPTLLPFHLGETIIAPGGFTIEVQEATANFQLEGNGRTEIRDPRPIAEQPPQNPGIWVRITPKEGGQPERRLLLEGIDWVETKQQEKFAYPELVLQLGWERWKSAGPPRYVLHWGAGAGPLLWGEDGSRTPVEIGKPIALPGPTKVVADQILHNVQFEQDTAKRVEFIAPHIDSPRFDEDFYATDPTGVELEVTTDPGTPKEKVELIRMASSDQGRANVWRSGDERFDLYYFTNSAAFPFEWRSVLAVWDHACRASSWVRLRSWLGFPVSRERHAQSCDLEKRTRVEMPEPEREIRVNDYFQYGGYRFFQTNAEPELPTYSGIGVVYDPGIPVVLAGMYTIILGAVLAFLVRPIVEGYGRRARQGAS